MIARQDFTVDGLWPGEPYRVIAFGVLYFTGLSVVDVVNEILPVILAKSKEKDPQVTNPGRYSQDVHRPVPRGEKKG